MNVSALQKSALNHIESVTINKHRCNQGVGRDTTVDNAIHNNYWYSLLFSCSGIIYSNRRK